MATTEEHLAAHDARLLQMHERLAAIEAHLTGIQTRLLGVGAFVGALMTVYKLW
jgi:hypothetical protein